MTAALPILQQAQQVTVASFDEGRPPPPRRVVSSYLRQHGVQATFKARCISAASAGDQLPRWQPTNSPNCW